MNKTASIYELQKEVSGVGMKFFFISKGQHYIIKVIQYSYIQDLMGRSIFNLGFGDYDVENDKIVDDIITNNGDAYKVFNSVLSSIPLFFENFANGILMIQGSDGKPEYIDKCKLSCMKKFLDECKYYNRRIILYRSYVDKNYDKLSSDYQFFGGFINDTQQTTLEAYECYKKYDAVFLFKK
jgi:hypothetical protein